jgi:hypothetical protein
VQPVGVARIDPGDDPCTSAQPPVGSNQPRGNKREVDDPRPDLTDAATAPVRIRRCCCGLGCWVRVSRWAAPPRPANALSPTRDPPTEDSRHAPAPGASDQRHLVCKTTSCVCTADLRAHDGLPAAITELASCLIRLGMTSGAHNPCRSHNASAPAPWSVGYGSRRLLSRAGSPIASDHATGGT